MGDVAEFPFEGVRGLDHTADVGLEVKAPTLPELFRRGALGAMWLVLEREGTADPGSSGQRRPVQLAEEDLSALFRAWLRTLLFWEETEGFVTLEAALSFAPVPLCSAEDGQAFGLEARVSGLTDTGPRVREVKGVTLHGLQVTQVEGGWMARVIFDV